jgi:hypothetical protein
MSKNYIASGVVLGKNWGGGFSAYPSRRIEAKTRAEILVKAKKELKTGGLDSGMGFEYLKGALLNIKEIETCNFRGKDYQRYEVEDEFIGDLTDKEQDFLLTCEF